MITRKSFLITCALAALGIQKTTAAETANRFSNLPALLEKLEKESGGRLGVAVLDMASGETSGHRSDERFALCSTFKMLLAAAILHKADTAEISLDRELGIPEAPLIANSPLTLEHAGKSMSIAALCHAILTRSDNTAANLLLDELGGPSAITRFAKSLGDSVTRLDRRETALNEAAPGDPRDTTSPRAMLGNLRTLLFGETLKRQSRQQLIDWMMANQTGDTRLLAHLPKGWSAADKTGSNGETTSNDIACFWPEKGGPILVTAYLTECPGPEKKREAVLAEIGRIVVESAQ